MIVLKQPLHLKKGEAVPIAGVRIFLICGFKLLASFGQGLLETYKAAIIAYTMPSLTALLAEVYLGERIGMRLVLALVIGMVGLAVLVSENLAALIKKPIGPTIMMLATLSWAMSLGVLPSVVYAYTSTSASSSVRKLAVVTVFNLFIVNQLTL